VFFMVIFGNEEEIELFEGFFLIYFWVRMGGSVGDLCLLSRSFG